MINNSKISIGLAQLSKPYYGAFNKKKKSIQIGNFKKILKLAIKEKIEFLDTSLNYKSVDDQINKNSVNLKNFKIITKVNIPLKFNKFNENRIEKKLIASLKKLKKKSFYGILIHNCKDIKNKKLIFKIKKFLEILKKKGLCDNYGLSLYSIKDYKRFERIINPKIIQANVNYFDREFLLNIDLNKKIKKKKILFFARSIFLQGALLQKYNYLPKKLKKLKKLIITWEKICNQNNLKKIEMAKYFIFEQNQIFKIIVGFQNFREFKEFIEIKDKKKIIDIYSKKKFDNFYNILKPYTW